jgi:hypothetical protein
MPPKKPSAVKLNRRGQKRLREALLGKHGYGFPPRMRGYHLVGEVQGVLEPLFDRNDHQKVPVTFQFPDPDDLAIGALSSKFWDRWFAQLQEMVGKHLELWNTWYPTPKTQVEVFREIDTGRYFYVPVWRKDVPLRMLLSSFSVRMRVTSTKAETQAREWLNEALSGRQRRELLLTGGFEEVGRSGVRYLIRANRPTVAYRQVVLPNRMRDIRFLAALCLHPLGYYDMTFAGCMPPSDEMLAHLQMIRADEKYYWRKCGQHGVGDPRSGL